MLDSIFFNSAELKKSFRYFHSRKRSDAFSDDNRGEPTLSSLIQNYEIILPAAALAIKKRRYELGPAAAHSISADKERTIYHFNWLDTFILFHYARCISILTEPLLPDSLFSFRKGRSASDALSRVQRFLRQHPSPLYVVRRDVKDFGDAMSHEHLIRDLVEYLHPSEALRSLFQQACRFKKREDESLVMNDRGLPGGHYLQLVCENLYLRELDLYLECLKPGLSIRFGDDILYMTSDLDLARKAYAAIDEFLSSRSVSPNPLKSREIKLIDMSRSAAQCLPPEGPFDAASNFTYLGAQVFWNGELAIQSKKLRLFRNTLRIRINAALRPTPSSMNDESRLELAVCAAKNILRQGRSSDSSESPLKILLQEPNNERQLKELDRWLNLLVIKAASQRGSAKGNFRSCSPTRLRALGLPSLLHLRRTRGDR